MGKYALKIVPHRSPNAGGEWVLMELPDDVGMSSKAAHVEAREGWTVVQSRRFMEEAPQSADRQDGGPMHASLLRSEDGRTGDPEWAWVLTREVNEYDQDGEYFVAWWPRRPSAQQLQDLLGSDAPGVHIMLGGGRIEHEREWFHLRRRKAGVP